MNTESKIISVRNFLFYTIPALGGFLGEPLLQNNIPEFVLKTSPLSSVLAFCLSKLLDKKEFIPPYDSPGTNFVAEQGNNTLSSFSTAFKISAGFLAGMAIRHYLPVIESLLN